MNMNIHRVCAVKMGQWELLDSLPKSETKRINIYYEVKHNGELIKHKFVITLFRDA